LGQNDFEPVVPDGISRFLGLSIIKVILLNQKSIHNDKISLSSDNQLSDDSISFAQVFYAPTNPEYPINATVISGVLNTGADMVIDDNRYSKVMVYDGNEPKFAWETDISTGRTVFSHTTQPPNGYLPLDPDVVLTSSRNQALVCYEADGEIWLSVWMVSLGGYVEIVGTFGNYTLPLSLGYGTNPNIDIGFDDEFVITWQSAPTVMIEAVAGDMLGGNLSLSGVAQVYGQESITPDVTVCDFNVTFTFIIPDDQGPDEWVTLETSYTDVSGNNISANPYVIPVNGQYQDGIYGRPRIASPPYYAVGNYSCTDYTTTVDYYFVDGMVGMWNIDVFQKNNQQYTNVAHIYNNYYQYVPNTEPAITYLGDLGVVSWTATIDYPGTNYNSLDVVGRYFQTSGSLGAPYGIPDAPVVNDHYDEVQHIPSVAGRRWNTGLGFYFWRDADQGDMYHRTGFEGDMSLRKEKEKVISGNQIFDLFSIQLVGPDLRITSELETYTVFIVDMTGRTLMQLTGEKETLISLSPLPKGIFGVVCTSETQRKSLTFVKY
jgi:hypothetical protein